ncbi:MAG: aspartate-semialdehyde dehydrogenase [Clostridia bacterium]|nr:aspartate-semialdehyde dehydrogenase [Clostridia bacterium]MBR6009455.1 aspartate-semialdehyde dehydrogenase [Clostridia bacterium]
MKTWNVAVLGATGAVGQQMLKVLSERNIPLGTVKALASASSAGKKVYCGEREIIVEETREDSFKNMDFVLGAVSNAMAQKFRPAIVKSGAVFIDNSSAFRLDADVPLVIPQINGEDAFKHNGVIANPNCSTIVTLMAISGIARIAVIQEMVACTYQAVSGAGREGIVELETQMRQEYNGEEKTHSVFPCQILSNAIPFIGSELDNDYTTEEMKMQNEGRKIMHLPELKVCCTCVRIPVIRSHSISVQLKLDKDVSLDDVKSAIKNAPGCVLAEDIDGRDYPTPLDVSDQDLVYVGRVRRDLINGDRGVCLWCCGDQIRKGAATNAVEILELLIK